MLQKKMEWAPFTPSHHRHPTIPTLKYPSDDKVSYEVQNRGKNPVV
eukprot:gene56194-66828_t